MWRDVWITNDKKRGERREMDSCFSWPFACFVIRSADAEIDALVYELYGLSEEEIGIVEGRLDRE